jgi:hypothetical protein
VLDFILLILLTALFMLQVAFQVLLLFQQLMHRFVENLICLNRVFELFYVENLCQMNGKRVKFGPKSLALIIILQICLNQMKTLEILVI